MPSRVKWTCKIAFLCSKCGVEEETVMSSGTLRGLGLGACRLFGRPCECGAAKDMKFLVAERRCR